MNKNLIRYLTLSLVLLSVLLNTNTAHAGDPQSLNDGIVQLFKDVVEKDPALIKGSANSDVKTDIIQPIINWLLGLVAFLGVGVLVIGGVMYITSLGDDERAKRAKKLILYAVIGLLVIGMAAIVVNLVFDIFGSAATSGGGGVRSVATACATPASQRPHVPATVEDKGNNKLFAPA